MLQSAYKKTGDETWEILVLSDKKVYVLVRFRQLYTS